MSMKRVSIRSNTLVVATTILFGFTAISYSLLLSTPIKADSVVDDISIVVPISCTLSGVGMNTHTTSMNGGNVQGNVGTTTLKALCNDQSGFAIYAIGFTNDTLGNNKLIASSINSEINTGTNTTGNSSWAMKLNTDANATYPITIETAFNNQYASVPSSYTKVASRAGSTDVGNSANGATLTTTYQIYASATQPAGTYIGKVKYTLVHPNNETPPQPQPSHNNSISYYANSSVATGVTGDQYIATGDTTALTASNFARPQYGFAGWNDQYDYSGTFYGMNETINVTSEMATSGLSLYAVWVPSEGSMQDASKVASVCNNLTAASASGNNSLSSVAALTDNRDGNTYAIAKLADGKCWMIENLRLSNTELTTNNTHNPVTVNSTVSIVNDDGTTTNHLSATSSNWCIEETSACVDQSKLNTDNTALYLSNTTGSKTGNVYSYGNYYNWYSATAGHGIRYTSANFTSPGDICPSGWRLPTGGSSNSEIITINNLANSGSTTTSAGLRTFPNNFAFAGMVSTNSGNISDRSWYGNYWTATDSYGGAYGLKIADGSGGASPTDIPWKYTGHSVRCVADL